MIKSSSKRIKDIGLTVSYASIVINLSLTVLKLVAGIVSHSKALIADAIHSASDVLTTVIVIVALIASKKKADSSHEYGHDKIENLASLFLAFLLGITGVELGWNSIQSIINHSFETVAIPGVFALICAGISIVVKEIMYQVTVRVGKKEKSDALIADAWHHRSDAMSSVGSLIGIIFSRIGYPLLDTVACLVICLFILKTAIEILIAACKKLTDRSGGHELEERMIRDIQDIKGVWHVDVLKSRQFGSGIYVDVEITVDGDLKLREAHEIAETVHHRIEESFPEVRHCMVHVNPENHEE